MAKGVRLRRQDIDSIRRELAPVMGIINTIAREHEVSVTTILKYAALPGPIHVRAVPVKGLHEWNGRIAGQ